MEGTAGKNKGGCPGPIYRTALPMPGLIKKCLAPPLFTGRLIYRDGMEGLANMSAPEIESGPRARKWWPHQSNRTQRHADLRKQSLLTVSQTGIAMTESSGFPQASKRHRSPMDLLTKLK